MYLALGELVGSYINAINDPNAIPNVTNAWDFYVKNKIADVKQDALKKYDQSMAKLTRLPCDGKKLLEDHDSSAKEATEKFMEETAELNCTTLKDELMDLTVSKSHLPWLNVFFAFFFGILWDPIGWFFINLN